MTAAEPMVPPELAAFLESGLVVIVATRDADLSPDCVLAVGLRVHPEGRHVSLFLGEEPAARAIANLKANGAVAITASRPRDYRTFQLKGQAARVEPVAEDERGALVGYREALATQLEAVGWARAVTQRLTVWPCVVAEIELTHVFEQTPGPRAGAPMVRR